MDLSEIRGTSATRPRSPAAQLAQPRPLPLDNESVTADRAAASQERGTVVVEPTSAEPLPVDARAGAASPGGKLDVDLGVAALRVDVRTPSAVVHTCGGLRELRLCWWRCHVRPMQG